VHGNVQNEHHSECRCRITLADLKGGGKMPEVTRTLQSTSKYPFNCEKSSATGAPPWVPLGDFCPPDLLQVHFLDPPLPDYIIPNSHRQDRPDQTVPSVSCLPRQCEYWILDDSRLSPTGNLKSEHVNSNCPIHTTTPDTTQTRPSCRVRRAV